MFFLIYNFGGPNEAWYKAHRIWFNSQEPAWELPLPKGCFLGFWAFLVETKKIAKDDPGSKFQAQTYDNICIEFWNQIVEKSTWKDFLLFGS